MARAIWSGSISFGLINIPVKLFTAIRDRSIHFHMMSQDGNCRLRRKLVCPETGKEYDFDDTARGYEIAPDQYILVTDEELAALRPESGRTIDIDSFVDLDEIDPMLFDRPYYLMPEEHGAKPYQLLSQALRSSGRVAICRFVMRDQEYLAAIRPLNELLCLETMRFADEVVPSDELTEMPRNVRISPRELDMADQLIESLTTEFDPDAYHDEFREAVEGLIERKKSGKHVVAEEPKEPASTGKVIDLMEALRRSLADVKRESAKPEKRPSADSHGDTAKKAPSKRKRASARSKTKGRRTA